MRKIYSLLKSRRRFTDSDPCWAIGEIRGQEGKFFDCLTCNRGCTKNRDQTETKILGLFQSDFRSIPVPIFYCSWD